LLTGPVDSGGDREPKQFLDARLKLPRAMSKPEYNRPPFTVECRAKLFSAGGFNVLVANRSKESSGHWEIYSYAGSGAFSVYLPEYSPREIVSTKTITDSNWHRLAFTFDGWTVRLFVDGEKVAERKVDRFAGGESVGDALTFGHVLSRTGEIGCDGLISDVRISKGVHEPGKVADEDVVGFWRFDSEKPEGTYRDASPHANFAIYTPVPRASLDEIDNRSYNAALPPMAGKPRVVKLKERAAEHTRAPQAISLDGEWEMAENGIEDRRLNEPWPDAIPAFVPGSVHTALERAGRIPDPNFGRNDAIAHDKSFQTWWFKKTFDKPAGPELRALQFGGVANKCTVWLNGEQLGSHDGMFGGPTFSVYALLQDKNTLIVKVEPAPGKREDWDNPAWVNTVTFNCVYGWHYSSIPALGIWRSVTLLPEADAAIRDPFVATKDAQKGVIDLAADIWLRSKGAKARLEGTVVPENFEGAPYSFTTDVDGQTGNLRLRFAVPKAKLWWPNDMGEPNLYRLKLSLIPERGLPDYKEVVFGIRTIEMAPLPGGPNPKTFNWTFVVNKKPMFVKGAGWCTMDSSMDFSRARYERLISLAKLQHVQMLRAWGSGMPETDDFYDLCNRYGIMVMQEWPTAWNSHNEQPFAALEETVRLNTLRIRNNPSLAIYTGGNESSAPFGKAIDMMGRYAIELDGTRAFHRGEPWGGSAHNYDCYWGMEPLDHNLNMTASFWGEFGLASMPVLESVLRYLPKAEQGVWPAKPDGSLMHHTPKFNTAGDWDRLDHYSKVFTECTTLEGFIRGSQLSQAVGVRHTLERARTRRPDCSGALYYKMNDNYPAASWSCVDWYGAPKIGHYVFQDAFEPLHACVLPSSLDCEGKGLNLPVFLLDDNDALRRARWQVNVRAFDQSLKPIKDSAYRGSGSIKNVSKLGEFTLTAKQTESSPLFVVTEVLRGGVLVDRSFVFLNMERRKDSLFTVPQTVVSLKVENGRAILKNEGGVPALGVTLVRPGHADSFTAADGFLWLDPGESKAIEVNSTEGLSVEGWNLKGLRSEP
jgi:beta-mannosidase